MICRQKVRRWLIAGRAYWRMAVALVLAPGLGGCLAAGTPCRPETRPVLINPYAGVDWMRWGQYRANLHAHTTQSDGKLDPQSAIHRYHSMGYSILAITDHEKATYPWSRFGVSPGEVGMVAVEGVELYTEAAHLNSYFSDLGRLGTMEKALKETAARQGLVILNHPSAFNTNPPSWFVPLYRQYPHFIGLETFNGVEHLHNGLPFWDWILDELMPERPVWGFASDDMHVPEQAGHHWTVFLLPALNEQEVRRAMAEGRFYACSDVDGPHPPRLRAIRVDTNAATVTIEAEKAKIIRWIAHGEVVHQGTRLNYGRLSPEITYVRAELVSREGGRACTNPFGLLRSSDAPPRPASSSMRARQEARRAEETRRLPVTQAASWLKPHRGAERTPPDRWRRLDLRSAANRALSGEDAWIGRGLSLTPLAGGLHVIHGVPFWVLDPSRNAGRAAIALRSPSLPMRGGVPLPAEVAIPVDARVSAVYVLHGAGFVDRFETVATYGFEYADGTREAVEIVGLGHERVPPGEQRERHRRALIQDWWPTYPQFENERARFAMVADDDADPDRVRYLYTLRLENPLPRKVVRHVFFQAQPESKAVVLILAATAAVLP